jgi:hypothetical protein
MKEIQPLKEGEPVLPVRRQDHEGTRILSAKQRS